MHAIVVHWQFQEQESEERSVATQEAPTGCLCLVSKPLIISQFTIKKKKKMHLCATLLHFVLVTNYCSSSPGKLLTAARKYESE